MSIHPQQQTSHTTPINTYLPAILKKNKSGWVIEYYVVDPSTSELSRKRVKLQRIISRYNSQKEANKHIQRMIFAINTKLSGGWNPFFENEDARMYERLVDITPLFLKEKTKELRINTLRSYSSFVNIFTQFSQKHFPDTYASTFTRSQAVRYLDYIYNDREANATTYNNHLKLGRTLFNWMLERCYTKQNPFESIKPKRKPTKTRTIISKEDRRRIIEYLKKENPYFLVVCKLIYTCMLRPNEIRQLKVPNIDLKMKYIHVPAIVSKNHKTRLAALTQDIIDDILRLKIADAPGDFHLFGSHTCQPSREMASNGRYGKEWRKMRKALKLPNTMQLYSLRDSGIFDMLKSGIDDLTVMQHADHSSLKMTTIYGNHRDEQLIKRIYDNAPKF